MKGHCADCGLIRRVKARGLCTTCYNRNYKHGTLSTFPKLPRQPGGGVQRGRARGDVAVEVADLLGLGTTRRQAIARHLGVKPASVYRALHRAGRVDLWERTSA